MGRVSRTVCAEATGVVVSRAEFDDEAGWFVAAQWPTHMTRTVLVISNARQVQKTSTHIPVVYLQYSSVEPRRGLKYLTRSSEYISNQRALPKTSSIDHVPG